MNYEPFNYEKYKAGRKAVTRDGRVPEQLTAFRTNEGMKYVGVVNGRLFDCYPNGRFFRDGQPNSDLDLFLLPEVREVWVAVDEDRRVYGLPFKNEEEADAWFAKNVNSDVKKAKLIIYDSNTR